MPAHKPEGNEVRAGDLTSVQFVIVAKFRTPGATSVYRPGAVSRSSQPRSPVIDIVEKELAQSERLIECNPRAAVTPLWRGVFQVIRPANATTKVRTYLSKKVDYTSNHRGRIQAEFDLENEP